MTRRWTRAVLAVALAAAPAVAHAQGADVDPARGPSSELYLRKRPPAPAAPVLSDELRALLEATETKRDERRLQAIELLREFLAGDPTGETHADGLFKLAELLWEESRRLYLVAMDDFSRELEACARKSGGCEVPPKEPRIQLGESERLYAELLDAHPDFGRADLAKYLIGFAAKEDGREGEAMERFRQVIDEHPTSPLYGDAWMMVGEHHFAAAQWTEARDAYSQVLADPRAATYDLAMFKTAWCDWKLGDIDSAARRFKTVLDLAVEAERAGSAALQRRRASLRDEALEYLVVVFTEDRSISAKEVFDFLASIGGERYSRDVLVKVAESYVAQGEYDRATDTYRFLIQMDPAALKAAEYQRGIVANASGALDEAAATAEMRILVDTYGPRTPWAKGQRNKDALARSLAVTEELVRTTATNFHAEAQAREQPARKGAKPPPPDLALYGRAADAYALYLDAFGQGKAATPEAVEVRFLRAEILLFKLGQLEQAGDEYMAVGRTAPVGPRHKDALLKAMDAFEKARPKDTAGRRQLVEVDKKFGEAIDLYATLFPADPELVGVIFKNGQMFFDYGEYDEAIKRFGVIVTKYPDHPDAGPAGDRILAALNKGEDYENIEDWARKLKGAKAFASKDQQERLDRLIVESIGKSGEKYADAGKYEQAAGFYLRVPKEFPQHALAPTSMMNAGVMYEKAKRPERAADLYLQLAEQYPQSVPGEKAAFTAGQVYERVAYFDRAAAAYELVVDKFPKSPSGADALFNAGLLRQALGEHERAIAHYQAYAKRFRERKDAADVAFNIGVVYEEAGDDGRAEAAFRDFLKAYRGSARATEALLRAGRCAFRLGQLKRAAESFTSVLRTYDRARGKDRTAIASLAAEARYHQGELVYRDFEKLSLEVPPSKLDRALRQKSELLGKAQSIYLGIADYKDVKWATAALYRAGQIFDGFAEALTTAPTPPGLSEDDAQAYRDTLDMYVVDIQDKALQLFSAGYAKAIQLQVYDEYTAKIREALGRLAADQFPPERESRAGVRKGDRALTVELVTEVVR
ncbi:MAG: tetratricopeptide repeat protein [Kofleriaceae bacterium]